MEQRRMREALREQRFWARRWGLVRGQERIVGNMTPGPPPLRHTPPWNCSGRLRRTAACLGRVPPALRKPLATLSLHEYRRALSACATTLPTPNLTPHQEERAAQIRAREDSMRLVCDEWEAATVRLAFVEQRASMRAQAKARRARGRARRAVRRQAAWDAAMGGPRGGLVGGVAWGGSPSRSDDELDARLRHPQAVGAEAWAEGAREGRRVAALFGLPQGAWLARGIEAEEVCGRLESVALHAARHELLLAALARADREGEEAKLESRPTEEPLAQTARLQALPVIKQNGPGPPSGLGQHSDSTHTGQTGRAWDARPRNMGAVRFQHR